ncbi:MAG: hypothetical protein L0Z55_07880 [Planctomycetes bacterium]|nr:hypothetical protein [Planctomycetota bacterium]
MLTYGRRSRSVALAGESVLCRALACPYNEHTVAILGGAIEPQYGRLGIAWETGRMGILASRTVMACVCFLAFSWLGSSLEGADLFRLRILPIPDTKPNCNVEIKIVVDHVRVPLPPGPPDSTKFLQAFTFGLELPSWLQYLNHTYDGTHLKQALGQDPWYSSVRVVPSGLTVAVVFDSAMAAGLEEGQSQIVLRLFARVASGTPPQTAWIRFRDNLGTPNVPISLAMRGPNVVVPQVMDRSFNVGSGTCMKLPGLRYHAAAVGCLQEAQQETELGSADAIPDVPSLAELLDEFGTEVPDSTTLEFPEPVFEDAPAPLEE